MQDHNKDLARNEHQNQICIQWQSIFKPKLTTSIRKEDWSCSDENCSEIAYAAGVELILSYQPRS